MSLGLRGGVEGLGKAAIFGWIFMRFSHQHWDEDGDLRTSTNEYRDFWKLHGSNLVTQWLPLTPCLVLFISEIQKLIQLYPENNHGSFVSKITFLIFKHGCFLLDFLVQVFFKHIIEPVVPPDWPHLRSTLFLWRGTVGKRPGTLQETCSRPHGPMPRKSPKIRCG